MDIQAIMANQLSIKQNEGNQSLVESEGMDFNQLFSNMIASKMKEIPSKDVNQDESVRTFEKLLNQDIEFNDLQDFEALVQLLTTNSSNIQEMEDDLTSQDAETLLDWLSTIEEKNLLASDASTDEIASFQTQTQTQIQDILSMLTEENDSTEKLVDQLLSGQKDTDQILKNWMQALINREKTVSQDIKTVSQDIKDEMLTATEQFFNSNQRQNQAEIPDANLGKETLLGMSVVKNAHEQKNISLESSIKEQLMEVFGAKSQNLKDNAEITEIKEKLIKISAASNVQENKEISDKVVFDTSNIMMKLKALSQSGANGFEEVEYKKNGEKIQQPIVDKVVSVTLNDASSPKLSSEDSSQQYQANDQQRPILQNLDVNKILKSDADSSDTFNAAIQESADLGSTVEHAKAHETLAQLGSKVSSNTTLIKNMDAVQMAMSQQISKMGDKEKSTLTVKLQPEELGKMRIELELKDNVIQGKIYVENESAKNALQQQMQTMRDQMKNQGISVESLEVDIGSESFQDSENQQETLKDSKLSHWVSRKTHSKSNPIFVPTMDYAGSTGESRLNAFA